MVGTYDVSRVLPVEEVDPGTNLLVAGPPMTGKRTLAFDLLEGGCTDGEASVVVTTRESTDRLRNRYDCLEKGMEEGRTGIVDCVTRERGDSHVDSDTVRYVASPGDITDIGIRVGGLFQAVAEYGAVRTGLVSASTLLMYADLRRVYRFLHVLTGKVQSHDWLGVTVVETSDVQALDALAPLFDGLVRTRETDDGWQMRVVGLDRRPTDWVTY